MSKSEVSWDDALTHGNACAGFASWLKWHSVKWAIFHSCCSWLYVIYRALGYGK